MARSEAARAIVAEFRNAEMDAESEKWAYGNALATIGDDEIADDLLELVRDAATAAPGRCSATRSSGRRIRGRQTR
jgi:hypothetical protein